MPIIDETASDGEFASLFESAAHEKRVCEDKRQAQFLLQLLNDMEDQEDPLEERRTEHLRIGPSGDIIRNEHKSGRDRGKVMTVDDLPKESEYEMLFGKPEAVEPQLIVETGRRLVDGKEKQNILFPSLQDYRLDLGNMRFETIVLVSSVAVFAFALFWRAVRWFGRRRHHQEVYHHTNVNDQIEMEVQRRVGECLVSLLNKDKAQNII